MTNQEDILDSLQEESDTLIQEMQRMAAERQELSQKVLMLEQANFQLSEKQV